jgi:hypothetical protein
LRESEKVKQSWVFAQLRRAKVFGFVEQKTFVLVRSINKDRERKTDPHDNTTAVLSNLWRGQR